MTDQRLWPADPDAAEQLLNFFLLEKAFYEIEYELSHRPDWLRVPADRNASECCRNHPSRPHDQTARRGLCDHRRPPLRPVPLSRPAQRGRPQRGARVPARASKVEAIGEHGETAPLERIHDAGLFAGALPNGSKRYQLRARFGDNVVELDDPYRFPPVLTDFDLYLLGEGTHQRIYDKLGAHPMTLDGVDGVAFVVLAPNARRVSVVGDFNFWNRAAASDAGARHRLLGTVRARMPAPATTTNSTSSARDGQHLPLKSDPVAFAAEMRPTTASIVLDETKLPHPRPAPSGINALERADVDLRGPSRLVAAQGRQ